VKGTKQKFVYDGISRHLFLKMTTDHLFFNSLNMMPNSFYRAKKIIDLGLNGFF
jgi:hypothetical protein